MRFFAPAIVVATALFSSGCASYDISEITNDFSMTDIITDLHDNDFVSITPEPLTRPIEGMWSGNIGPYLVSIRINEDGTGEMCSSYAATDSIARVKHYAGDLYTQEGSYWIVKSYQGSRLKLGTPYDESTTYHFIKDENLDEASRFCQQHFAQ